MMGHRLCLVISILVISLSTLCSQVTISARLSQDTITIGEQVDLTYVIKFPQAGQLASIDMSSLDSTTNLAYTDATANNLDEYMDWDIINTGAWARVGSEKVIQKKDVLVNEENGQKIIKNTVRIAIYSVGVFDIEVPKVNLVPAISEMPLERPRLTVLFPESLTQKDSITLQPIKPIIEEEVTIEDFFPYLYAIGALAALWFLFSYLFKPKETSPDEAIEEEIIIRPAHEIALESLDQLKSEELWQKGEIKAYQSRLTDTIRQYLENRFDIKAMEMTTDEISRSLKHTSFDRRYEQKLKEILQVADMIKFAKAKPDESIHDLYLEEARSFVLDTKQAFVDPETNESS